jgi:ribonuclease HIII
MSGDTPVKTSFTFKLTDAQQRTLIGILRGGNYRPAIVPHTKIAVATPDYNVSLYTSGKCLVQGKGAADFVTFVMEPLVLEDVQLGYEDVLHPDAIEPHAGVDESGKGDFFGPLVIAAAYVDRKLAPIMRKMDVKDSKKITSDSKALDMGRDLRKLLGRRFAVVKIGPLAYNRLYSKMRNVNRILAWGHARAIENILESIPDCPRAISDQFGSKEQVLRALMRKGSGIKLEQRHRAESDLAVAAASIIAREIFLRSLWEMKERHKMTFPKGASDAVRAAAVALVRQNDPRILLETAKCHFKTTDQVLQEVKADRSALGPEGQAVSQPVTRRFGSHRPKEEGEKSEDK